MSNIDDGTDMTVDQFPKDPQECLDWLFPGKSPANRVGEHLVSRTGEVIADHIRTLVAQNKGSHAFVIRYVSRALHSGPSTLEAMERALDLLFDDLDDPAEHPVVRIGRGQDPLDNDNERLKKIRHQPPPRITWLLDQWWREHHRDLVDSPEFDQAWDRWTRGNSEALLALRRGTVAQWRKKTLMAVARQTRNELPEACQGAPLALESEAPRPRRAM